MVDLFLQPIYLSLLDSPALKCINWFPLSSVICKLDESLLHLPSRLQ